MKLGLVKIEKIENFNFEIAKELKLYQKQGSDCPPIKKRPVKIQSKNGVKNMIFGEKLLERVTACLKNSTCVVRFPVVAPPQIGSFIYQKTRI